MARKGNNVYLRNTGKWEGRYVKTRMTDGRIRYGYVSGNTYEETLKKREEAANAYAESIKDKRIAMSGSPLLFSAASGEWLEERKSFLKESSIIKYYNILNQYILPEFGNKYIAEITKEEVSDFLIGLFTSGGKEKKGLSLQMIRSIISVLKSIAEYVQISRNISVLSFGRLPFKESKKPLRVFSVSEQYRLEQYLLSDMDGVRLGIMLCLYTGIRLGELCALKWGNISFENRKLIIHATMMRIQTPDDPEHRTKVIVTSPKSACSVREIPLPTDIFKLLQKMEKPKDTYFLTGCSNVYVEPRTMENRFKAITAACGISNANFHALRHTFATKCIEQGFDVKSLSEILGHASVNITMDRYVHPTMELKQKNMDKLSIFCTKKNPAFNSLIYS